MVKLESVHEQLVIKRRYLQYCGNAVTERWNLRPSQMSYWQQFRSFSTYLWGIQRKIHCVRFFRKACIKTKIWSSRTITFLGNSIPFTVQYLVVLCNKCNVQIIRIHETAAHGKGLINAMSSFGIKFILREEYSHRWLLVSKWKQNLQISLISVWQSNELRKSWCKENWLKIIK